jgi:hemolysin activation/secretion protein
MSLSLLQDLATAVIAAYRASDHPLVDVYLPEQDITAGKVQLVVREAVLGEVRVEGARHSKPERLVRQVRLDPGDRINSRILEEDLEWLNEAPGRTVDLIYERGQVDGTSDIVLRANDLRLVQAYVGYGNTGINATGQTEWNAGLIWNNVFGLDHVASYAFSGDAELDNLNAHSLVYQVPLPWRHRVEVLGAYVVSSTDLGDTTSPLGVDGESIQASTTYRIPLPRPRRSWRHEVSLGWDYKSTNTDLLFGGASLFATSAEVFQFRVGYGANYDDDWGRGAYEVSLVHSPGDVLRRNTDADFSALRSDTAADYTYLTASAQRFVELPAGFGFLFRADGQYSGSRLLSTEQLLAGGWRTVRGFDENLARGDSGVVLTSQLMLPTDALSARLSDSVWPGENRLAVFLFQDSGFLANRGSLPGETDPSLHAAGLGFEWRGGEAFSLRGSYGWNLGTWGLGDVEDGKFHFGMSLRY